MGRLDHEHAQACYSGVESARWICGLLNKFAYVFFSECAQKMAQWVNPFQSDVSRHTLSQVTHAYHHSIARKQYYLPSEFQRRRCSCHGEIRINVKDIKTLSQFFESLYDVSNSRM